jgi:pimeloyl-ACP methyl ester carboxylesterase
VSKIQRIEFFASGVQLSALVVGNTGPHAMFLHGTYWSRVWQPILDLAGEKCRCVAIDFPGFGRSKGELTPEQATIPALAQTVLDAADSLEIDRFMVIGHDIGGAVAQHLAVHASERILKMILVNSVMFDSWPVPGVARYRDPVVRKNTTTDDILKSRRQSLARAIARPMSVTEVNEYLSPWEEPQRARSWMAMAAAADAKYTVNLEAGLIRRELPTLIVWGRDDEFQLLSFAEHYEQIIPGSSLAIVEGKHIPQEDAPEEVGALIADFLTRTDDQS